MWRGRLLQRTAGFATFWMRTRCGRRTRLPTCSRSYAPYAQWQVGEGAQGAGLTMLFTRLSPPALFAVGDVDAVAAALEKATLPDSVYMTLRAEHYAVASQVYDFSADIRPMWRMRLGDPAQATREIPLPAGHELRALDAGDSARIRELHAQGGDFTPDAFAPYQAEDGTFFGVADERGRLLAVGGTHVVDWERGRGRYRQYVYAPGAPRKGTRRDGAVCDREEADPRRRDQHCAERGRAQCWGMAIVRETGV